MNNTRLTRQDYVKSEIASVTGYTYNDIMSVKSNDMTVEFNHFKDISDFNKKFLIKQGITSKYVKLDSLRNEKKHSGHVKYVFQCVERDGQLVKLYQCLYLPDAKPEIVKPETVSVTPTNAQNNRRKTGLMSMFNGKPEPEKPAEQPIKSDIETRVDSLESKLDLILSKLG